MDSNALPHPSSLTLDSYQVHAVRTAKTLRHRKDRLLRGILGLCAEAGELANRIKKCYYQDQQLDDDDIVEELGDILWYLAVLTEDLHYGLGHVAIQNINKLRKRYPHGYRSDLVGVGPPRNIL